MYDNSESGVLAGCGWCKFVMRKKYWWLVLV